MKIIHYPYHTEAKKKKNPSVLFSIEPNLYIKGLSAKRHSSVAGIVRNHTQ